MKLTVLETALRYYKEATNFGLECTEDTEEREHLDQLAADIANCEIELAEMKKAETDRNITADVYVIPVQHMIDYGNRMWYNTYGRMARRLPNGSDIPANFINAVKDEGFECDSTTSALLLEDVHGLLNDLWHANEGLGDNDTDGTFKSRTTQADIDWICELIHAKLDKERSGEIYEKYFAILQRLHQERDYRKTGHWTTTYCGAEECGNCDGSACRPC